MPEIKVGQIWQVTTNTFETSTRHGDRPKKTTRPVKLLHHEYIEIRFPFEWHFRTTDNEYFHAEPDMIYQNCRYVGTISPDVEFSNRAELSDIIRLKLYNE